jgi:hypothetical protein
MLVKVVSDDPGVQDWVIRQTAWNSDLFEDFFKVTRREGRGVGHPSSFRVEDCFNALCSVGMLWLLFMKHQLCIEFEKIIPSGCDENSADL